MKIGIVTFWTTKENYGQLLQCYASQTFLRSLGYEAYLIRYKKVNSVIEGQKKNVLSQIRKLFSASHWRYIIDYKVRRELYIKVINRFCLNHNVDRGFKKFFDENIVSTPTELSEIDLQKSPPVADVYMVGSDIVWGQDDPIYFLQFGDSKVRRMSLAASFGNTLEGITDARKERIRKYLENIDLITLREDEGVRICRHLGFESVLICDPVMLLAASDYSKIAAKAHLEDVSQSVFMYFIHSDPSVVSVEDISKYLQKKCENYNYAGAQWAVNRLPKVFPTMEQWIAYVEKSKFIITNSFHGVVLSILFNKQFVVIPLKVEGRNTRIETILKKTGLENRICSSLEDLEKCMNSNIDYSCVNNKVKKIQSQSRSVIIDFITKLPRIC